MANLIEMSEQMKAVPDQWLESQIQNPSGMVPPYLVLSELNRRKSLRSKMAQAPTSTVAQDVVGAQQPAPPGMATPDTLSNQQPQPQLPQSAPAGVPNPMAGGLAASAPPKPMAPPAPQRMAGGGLVGGGFVEGEPRFEEEMPWWQRGLGMYGMSGGMMGIGPALLAGLFGKRGKKAEAEPVRAAGGAYFGSMKLPYNYGTSILSSKDKDDDLEIITDELGNRVMTKGGKRLATFKPQAKFEMPDYVDTIPQSVKRPDLGAMLAEVQKVTARPEGPTALDRRIESLEAERDKVRKPFWGDALTELGLGIMSSRSPYAMQAVGEAGLGAMHSWRAQQARADQQRMAIEDRLLGVESQRESQRESNRRADLQLADTMASREHGANVTEQQLAGQRAASRQSYELKKAELAHQAAQSAISQDNTLNSLMLTQALKDKPHLDPNSPEVLAARRQSEMDLIEHRAKMEARYRKADGLGGLGGLGKLMEGQAVNDFAKSLIGDEYKKWGVGQGDSTGVFLDRVGRGVRDKILKNEYNDPRLQHPFVRWAVAEAAGSMRFDPKNDPIWLGATDYIKTGKAGKPATSISPTQVGGEKQEGDITGSGSGSGSATSANPKVNVTVPRPEFGGAAPMNRPSGPSNYLQHGPQGPWIPPALRGLTEKPGSVAPRSEYQVGKPVAYLRPEEEEDYLRNLALMGRYA